MSKRVNGVWRESACIFALLLGTLGVGPSGCLLVEPLDAVKPSASGAAGAASGNAGKSGAAGASNHGGANSAAGGATSTGGRTVGGASSLASGGTSGSPSGGATNAGSPSGGATNAGSPSGGAASTDPDGYLRSGDWHGYVWSSTAGSASITPASFDTTPLGMPYCASGSIPASSDFSACAMIGVNLDQSNDGSSPMSVAPNQSGVVVTVSNASASPLRLILNGATAADTWCVDFSGGGGFFPWSIFRANCWTTGGVAYANQALESIVVLVPGNDQSAIPFDFCLTGIYPANSGPTRNCVWQTPACSPALIDDFEGTAGAIYDQDGRSGSWYDYDDQTTGASHTVNLHAAGFQSANAIENSGRGYTSWGADIAFSFNQPPGATKKWGYDASRYAGIKFYYKSVSAFTVQLATLSTSSSADPYVEGGTCPLTQAGCINFQTDLPAAASWTLVTLHWSDLVEPSWSSLPSAVLNPAELVSLNFQGNANTVFDYALDDVSFF